MLKTGFTLLEMLLCLILTSLLMMIIMAFYPKLQTDTIQFYQQYRLQETINQTLSGLIKDIKRAGFLANHLDNLKKTAILIEDNNQCIIIRYDLHRSGEWREDKHNLNSSDIFVYRYANNNVVYRLGIPHCYGQGWEKLFDNNEVDVTLFEIYQRVHFIEIRLTAQIKGNHSITHSRIHYVKTENL